LRYLKIHKRKLESFHFIMIFHILERKEPKISI